MAAEISVILPAHNVERTLETVFNQVVAELKKTRKEFEVIIAEDGSTDNTYKTAKRLAAHSKAKLLHSPHKLGKGGALNISLQKAKGQKRIFIDADYVNVPQFLPDLVDQLDKYDIVVGNRYDKAQNTKRIFKRLVASKGYIVLTKLFFFLPYSDLQCGFKGMNKHVVPLLSDMKSTDYFWDTEFLVKARRAGHTISELPITWVEAKSAHSARLLQDSFKFVKSLIKLRLGLL